MAGHQSKRRGNRRAGTKKRGHGKRRTHKQKGGFGGALASIVQTALVPFGIFAAQKMVQSRKNKSMKSRR